MEKNEKLRDARIVSKLPHIFGRNENVPADLVGATILNFGTFNDTALADGGGLVIDYQPVGHDQRRIVLAFNDVSMWVVGRFSSETP